MKRVIFGILALIGVWQLIQLPSVNAALFAFLTLGINPLTNSQFSTPDLISILFAIGFGSLLLLFSRAISDFFGGLADWLTRANRTTEASIEPVFVPSEAFAVGPSEKALAKAVKVKGPSLVLRTRVSLQKLSLPLLPHIELPDFRRYARKLNIYHQFVVAAIRLRLAVIKRLQYVRKQTATADPIAKHNKDISPELSEVVAIFEQMARDAAAAEPQEAVIIESHQASTVQTASIALRAGIQKLYRRLGIEKVTLFRDVAKASLQLCAFGMIAQNQAKISSASAADSAEYIARRVCREAYRCMLLFALGALLAGSNLLRILLTGVLIIGHLFVVTLRGLGRAAMAALAVVALGAITALRELQIGALALGRGLAVACRCAYKLFAKLVMGVMLLAGYALYIFALICMLAWELVEPYARALDKWIGDNLSSKDSLGEMSKVGHEMSRTFTQWYRVVRRSMHGFYR